MMKLVVSILVGCSVVALFVAFGWPFLILMLGILGWAAVTWGAFFLASKPGPGSKKKAAGLLGAALAVTIIAIGIYQFQHRSSRENKEAAEYAGTRSASAPSFDIEKRTIGLRKGITSEPWRVPSKFKGYRIEIWPRNLNVPIVVQTEVETDTIWRDKRPVFKPAWTYALLSPEADDSVDIYLAKPR